MCKDGQELRGLSPIKRQRLLKKIVKSPVLSADYLMGHGVDMFSGAMREGPGGNRRQGGRGRYQPEKTTCRVRKSLEEEELMTS